MRKFQVISRRSLILSTVATGIVAPTTYGNAENFNPDRGTLGVDYHIPNNAISPEQLIKSMQSVFIDGAMAFANYKEFTNPHHRDPGKFAFEEGHKAMECFTNYSKVMTKGAKS